MYNVLHLLKTFAYRSCGKGRQMSTTQPIRNGEDVQKLLNYYEQEKPNLRNYTLIICGLHTALRISDLLSLRWENVYDFKKQRYVTHLHVYEKKTGKHSVLALNHHVIQALEEYRNFRMPQPQDYIFPKRPIQPIRCAARRHIASLKKPPKRRLMIHISADTPCARPSAITHGKEAHRRC